MTHQPETARELLHRHGLPEDIIDGALCLHAQELAALQRLRMDELDLTGQKARIVGRIVDLIDPTRTPAAVSAAVAPPTNRAAVLREVADELTRKANQLTERVHDLAYFVAKDRLREAEILDREAAELRRMADETAPKTPDVDLPTLAAALDGLHTLIATSSRDWQTYRVDAWLWAVLCGWDCEQTEHDDTCVHGALEETAAMHGWDEATVAKARRYRAAVRAVTETLPAAGARQDETATETPAPDDRNAGPGWYEVITSPQATTCIAYVHEDGSLYLPEGDLTEEEFAFAAARGKAHRLVRADEQPAAGARQDGTES
jgi:hypothetical protein